MAIYSDDVQHFEFPSTLVASGAVQVRERLSVRLREPDLHARLVNRIAMGNLVIDQEVITRNFPEPEGIGTIELIAMFEVRASGLCGPGFGLARSGCGKPRPTHMVASEMPTTFWKATAL